MHKTEFMRKSYIPLLLFAIISWTSINAQWTNVGSANFTGKYAGSTSVAFDASGTPFVAFGDGNFAGKATVMKYSGGGWVLVGNAGFSAGSATGLTLAFSHNVPLVAFSDASNGSKATVMKLNSNNNTWASLGTAGFSAGAAYNCTLAIDSTGFPYVAYTDAANGNKASVMAFLGSTWANVGGAGFTPAAASYPALAMKGNTPYIVFSDGGSSITVMSYNGSSWGIEGNRGFGGNPQSVAIAVDHTGSLYVAAPIAGSGGGVYTYQLVGGTWTQLGTGATSSGTAQSPQLAIDANNVPYLVYQDVPNSNKATVLKYVGATWQGVGAAGITPGKAYNISIAIGPGNAPYVAFSDYTDSNKVTLLTFGGTASVNDLAEIEISVYPNPATSILVVDCPTSISNISIYDIEGRLVFQEKQPATNHYDISQFTTGMYLVKISTNARDYTKKIVKQ